MGSMGQRAAGVLNEIYFFYIYLERIDITFNQTWCHSWYIPYLASRIKTEALDPHGCTRCMCYTCLPAGQPVY